jgi:hypothetical protein
MTGADFEEALKTLYGDAWRKRAPVALKISVDTMDRYRANGPIPVAQVAVEALLREHGRLEGDRVRAARYARMEKDRR